jgi:hypothetical protein
MSLDLTLYELESGLADLASEFDRALELSNDGDPEAGEQLEILGEAFVEYIGARLNKIDGTADFVLMLDRLCHESRERKGVKVRCELDQEIDRLRGRRDRLRSIVARIKDNLKFVMESAGKTKLEGTRHTVRVQTNGGKQPVEIYDESLIDDWLCTAKIEMSWVAWLELLALAGVEKDYASHTAERIVRSSAVADEMSRPCRACNGKGEECASCNGTGKRSAPGARWMERGSHVVIS